MNKKKKLRWGTVCPIVFLCCILWRGFAHAETVNDSPYVKWSPDGQFWTIDEPLLQNREEMCYPKGTVVKTEIVENILPDPQVGEHKYTWLRAGTVPIGHWKLVLYQGSCIHKNESHPVGGMQNVNVDVEGVCYQSYWPGWVAYCADCGKAINDRYHYFSKETAAGISYYDTTKGYYYLCSNKKENGVICGHQEQAFSASPHRCVGISANRYRVVYMGNGATGGYVGSSIHMYNNETMYEGESVVPQTKLYYNRYTREGYVFEGWTTEADGTGTYYADGATIFNLTGENYTGDQETDEGTVYLYAKWRIVESTLIINPNGGTYNGKEEKTYIKKGYGSSYYADPSLVAGPAAFEITFVTNGGGQVRTMKAERIFDKWSYLGAQNTKKCFYAQSNRYWFYGTDGTGESLIAQYETQAVILPLPVRENYHFAGWYSDSSLTCPVGGAGDTYLPTSDTTLYAKWSELALQTKENMEANDGRGAVDLKWNALERKDVIYKVYQSADGINYTQLGTLSSTENTENQSMVYNYTGEEAQYDIQTGGFYQLAAYGAKGQDYSMEGTSFTGGAGGYVSGRFYLKKGDVLTITVGGCDGYGGGGAGDSYGIGGGASIISSKNLGILLVAGGGSGASIAGEGLPGGEQLSTTDKSLSLADLQAESGPVGGGGGYPAGIPGEVSAHSHLEKPDGEGSDGAVSKSAQCAGWKWEDGAVYYGKVISTSCQHYGHWGQDIAKPGTVCKQDCPTESFGYVCPHCGQFGPHYIINNTYECMECGANIGSSSTHKHASEWVLICTKEEGDMDLTTQATGGGNYRYAAALEGESKSGIRAGEGKVEIQVLESGCFEELELTGERAEDKAAPDKIEEATIQLTSEADNAVTVLFEAPRSNGTLYYHKVIAYEKKINGEQVVTSNITQNRIESAIKGYYYLFDNKATTVVGENGHFSDVAGVRLSNVTTAGYLHLAAVDRAGNIGETTHIRVLPEKIHWPIQTSKIQIADQPDTAHHSAFYPSSEQMDTYYVRADGKTAVTLSYQAKILGTASADYQVNRLLFLVEKDGQAGQQEFETALPYTLPLTSSAALPVEQFERNAYGTTYLSDASSLWAHRRESASVTDFGQAFYLSAGKNGQSFYVFPHAKATYQGGYEESVTADDRQNGIRLIADGEGPVLGGLEEITKLEQSDGTQNKKLVFTASDDLSGVERIAITVVNKITYDMESTEQNGDRILLEVDRKRDLYQGSYEITITAVDHVGNETVYTEEINEFGLTAELERVLSPHEPDFKGGEAGTVNFKVTGYADAVEIIFPKGLLDTEGKTVRWDYTTPLYTQKDAYTFYVCLTPKKEQDFTVTVRAYKAGRMLEKQLPLHVKAESILEEVRTRLR